MTSPATGTKGIGDDRTTTWVTAGAVIVAGGAFGLLRFFGTAGPGRNLEAATGALAFAAVIAAPGALVLLSLEDRPLLLLPAGMFLVPASFLSFTLVTLPLLVPAVLLLRTYARATSGGPSGRELLTAMVVFGGLAAALTALFVSQDPREYVTETVGYSTSDIVTYAEAALSLVLTVTAAFLGGWLAGTESFRTHRASDVVAG